MQLTKDEFLAELRAHIARKYVTQTNAALMWGFSKAYVSGVVRGDKAPNQKILKEMGCKRRKEVITNIVYEKHDG